MVETKTVADLQRDIVEWADKTFPNRQPSDAFLKMYSEISECIEDPRDPLEWADVFILLFDLANMHGVDVETAVRAKLFINKGRKWEAGPMGVMKHV